MKLITSVKRFDLGQITSMEVTPQGFLKMPGFATRVGVFTYRDPSGQVRRELRHPDDVFDPVSLETLRNCPVTNEHPPEMITPENFQEYAVGYLTDNVDVNRDLVAATLIVADEEAIDDINNGKRELSAGYLADLEEKPGVYNGTPYDVRQRNIKYNHVAVVERGRAGPEVRLRLDSADAVMEVGNIGEVLPTESAAFQPEGEMSDADEEAGDQTKKDQGTRSVVISGQQVEMPEWVADIWEDMSDRYDLMRGEVAKLTEETMKDKKDVDISQKNVSPQVKVVQMAPDGRSASGKVGAGDKMGPSRAKGLDDEDEHGVSGGVKPNDRKAGGAALADDDDDDKEEGKKDYEGESGQSGGVAMSPVDLLKNQMKEMKDNMDAMQAKLDEYASATMAGGEHKMDSKEKETQKTIRARVKLERQAEKILPEKEVAKFDSMSDDEIRASVIKHTRPTADLEGKSSVYLQARFDSIVEESASSEKTRKEMGATLLDIKRTRMDVEESNPDQKRREMQERSRQLWQEPLSTSKRQ